MSDLKNKQTSIEQVAVQENPKQEARIHRKLTRHGGHRNILTFIEKITEGDMLC